MKTDRRDIREDKSTMSKARIIFILSLILLSFQWLAAQQNIDARGTGMAFSNAADTRGLEGVGLNPATLALKSRTTFEFNLLSINASVSNNSLSKGLYDRYFTGGDSLSEADKSTLLQAVPGSGIHGNFAARVNTFALYLPNFSLALTGLGSGSVNLPREFVELSLYGNQELGRTYDFSNVDGVGWGGAAASVGFAVPFRFPEGSGFKLLSLGLGAKYISGLGYFEVINSQGRFQNVGFDNHSLQLDGVVEARTARGGSGYSFDLGLVAQTNEKWAFSLALLNGVSKVKWNNDTKSVLYSVQSDSLALSSEGFDDSLLVTRDTTHAISAFDTRLPAVVDLGVAYRVYKRLLFTAEFEKGLSLTMGGITQPRMAFGMEFTGIPFLPIRTGVSSGGGKGLSFALGSGLDFKFWYVDVALVNHGGIDAGKARGITASATTRFRF